MGNLCSKSPSKADNDPFAQPGRVLGSAPSKPSEPRAQIPKIASQGQKLGGSEAGDARTAAAKAAEDRLAKSQSKPSGKLGRDLADQKKMTMNDTLVSSSRDERSYRDADSHADARNWN